MGFKVRPVTKPQEIAIRPGLGLRMFTIEDVPALFAVVDKNRSYLREWMPWLDRTATEAELQPFLQGCLDGYASGISFRWALLIDGEIGGVIGLEDVSEMHRRGKIGYWQAQGHQGRGHITDAVRAVLRFGYEKRELNLIEIRAAVKNRKSRAVAERLGMKLDGILRHREWLYNHYVDVASYTLLASEWRDMSAS